MIARWLLMAMATLAAPAIHAEPAPTARGLFEGAWKRAECNQPIDMALNNARYHELGGGYSLGMVLCWLGPNSESQILFLVAPRTGGKPQLLRFEEWRDKKFVPVDVVSMADFDPNTRSDHQLSALQRERHLRAGRRMDLDRQGIQDDRLLGQAGLQGRQRIRPRRPFPHFPAEEVALDVPGDTVRAGIPSPRRGEG